VTAWGPITHTGKVTAALSPMSPLESSCAHCLLRGGGSRTVLFEGTFRMPMSKMLNGIAVRKDEDIDAHQEHPDREYKLDPGKR
jgi:hypothetical protein